MVTPYFNENGNFILYQGDTNCVLSEIKDKVDTVFADPPYFSVQSKTNPTEWEDKSLR